MATRPQPKKQAGSRRAEVERFFDEMGWEDLDRLDEWDGEDLEYLRRALSQEEYQALLDHLEETQDEGR